MFGWTSWRPLRLPIGSCFDWLLLPFAVLLSVKFSILRWSELFKGDFFSNVIFKKVSRLIREASVVLKACGWKGVFIFYTFGQSAHHISCRAINILNECSLPIEPLHTQFSHNSRLLQSKQLLRRKLHRTCYQLVNIVGLTLFFQGFTLTSSSLRSSWLFSYIFLATLDKECYTTRLWPAGVHKPCDAFVSFPAAIDGPRKRNPSCRQWGNKVVKFCSSQRGGHFASIGSEWVIY